MEFDPNKQKIAVADAASMLRAKVNKNEPPYTQETKKYNNHLVDECKKNLWMKICDDDVKIQAVKIWMSWNVYKEGIEMKSSADKLAMFTRMDDEKVKYWIEFFEQDFDVLLKEGQSTVKIGWESLFQELKLRIAEEKYRVIYSTSDDPVVWFKEANKRRDLADGTYFPFWNQDGFKDAVEKVRTILSIQVQPSN